MTERLQSQRNRSKELSAVAGSAVLVGALAFTGTIESKTRYDYQNPDFESIHSDQCDRALWSNVHYPTRLKVVDGCVKVTGKITKIKKPNPDGDTHFSIKLDEEYDEITNHPLFLGNEKHHDGTLVGEVVCSAEITDWRVQLYDPCKYDFVQSFDIEEGSSYEFVGALVSDTNHHDWLEVHPVTSIEVIPENTEEIDIFNSDILLHSK